MGKENFVIKRHGRTEAFDERKLFASVYAAGLATRVVEEKCEQIADKLCKEIKKWLKSNTNVTTDNMFEHAYEILQNLDARVALMYKTHRDIL